MKMPFTRLVILTLLASLILIAGCSREEEKKVEQQPVVPTESILSRVVVPDNVKGHWKAVRIKVLDKENNQEAVYTVDIGYSFTVTGSSVKLTVNEFLPTFVIKEKKMTSVSNKTDNPAVLISLAEGGKEIFNGWLFSLYPGTHAFQHPRYSFSLVDFIPAPIKKG